MLKDEHARQMKLFGDVIQPRYVKPEPYEIYRAVLFLRRLGLKVYRNGPAIHKVDGRLVTEAEMMRRYRALKDARDQKEFGRR